MKRFLQKGVSVALALLLAAFCPVALALGFSAEEVYESVFVIETDSAIGSGFAVSENEVVTNAHVIGDAKRISVVTYDGERLQASVVACDETLDLAMLYVAGGSFSPLTLASLDELLAGDDVYAIGAPKSMAYTLTKGIVSSKDRDILGQHYIQIDAAVNEGNSGGPLLDASGNVLGVITLKLTDAEGIGLAIPITVVAEWMEGTEMNEPAPSSNGEEPLEEGITSPPDAPPVNRPNDVSGKEKVDAALVIALSFSVLLNAVLAIALGLSRRNNRPVPNRSPDRTDFEIEFEE